MSQPCRDPGPLSAASPPTLSTTFRHQLQHASPQTYYRIGTTLPSTRQYHHATEPTISTTNMKSAGIAATCCALGASAFLLPPNLVPKEKAASLPFVSTNAKNQVLELPCSSCAFPAPKSEEHADSIGDQLFSIRGGANNLILNFTISEDGTTLELNKVPIYPAERSFENAGSEWKILQVPASVEIDALENGEVQGTPLHISGSGTKVSNIMSYHGDEIIPIKWQLLSLENEPMTVDEVAIQLIKTEEGELLILSVEHIDENMLDSLPPMLFGPPPPPHHHPHGPPQRECKSLPGPVCRLVHAMEDRVEMMKHSRFGQFGMKGGCHGRKGPRPHHMPGHIKPHLPFGGSDERPHGHHGTPHHMRPHGHHGHHGHHHHRHHYMHSFFKGFVAIMIPVMAGIFFGLLTSIVGLVLGRFIGWLWIRVVRDGKRGYASVAQDDAAAEEDDSAEKAYAHADELEADAPPMYEDAPAYELGDEKKTEQ